LTETLIIYKIVKRSFGLENYHLTFKHVRASSAEKVFAPTIQ